MSDEIPSRGAVIIVGASPDRSRYSNKAVRAYGEAGYTVIPVHPTAGEIEGHRAYRSISAVPTQADLLLLYVRPEIGLSLLDEAVAKGVRRVFVNPGTGSPELLERILELEMEPVEKCAIVALGRSPAQFPD